MNNTAMPGKTLIMTGVVLIVFGVLLLVAPVAALGAVIKLVALVLMITGVVQLIQGFKGNKTGHKLVSAALGIIVAGVGVLVWLNPELGSGFLTALLMIFFLVHGLWNISTSFRYRNASGWIWLSLSGLLSLVFVYLLWKQWPLSGAWAIGVLVGLDLLLTGLAMIVLGASMRKVRSTGDVDTISL